MSFKKDTHMASRRISTRFMLLIILLFVLAACSSDQPGTTKTATNGASMRTKALTATPLQTLEQRPLQLPIVAPGASCPTSPEKRVDPRLVVVQGDGPVYATTGTDKIMSPAVLFYADAQHWGNGVDSHGWGGAKVIWFVNPSYHGLVLIRGHQVDGPYEIRFDIPAQFDAPAQQLMHQLVIDPSRGGSPWPNGGGNTRLQAPGCYAYQVDGTTFSYVIVFKAVVQN